MCKKMKGIPAILSACKKERKKRLTFYKMTNSISKPSFIMDVVEEYPYPSHISTPNLVTVKLSGLDKYNAWKTQMSCLLKSHDMLGFINGKFISPDDQGNIRKKKVGDVEEWERSDSLVKSWILGSLSEDTTMDVIHRLTSRLPNQDFTAKDAWDELKCIYDPEVIQQAPEEEIMTREADLITEEQTRCGQKLYEYTVSGNWESVDDVLKGGGVTVTNKITSNGNTALHVAVATNKNHKLLRKMLETIPSEYKTLVDLVNWDGSTLLHIAAMVGNTEAVDILMRRNPDMVINEDAESHTPLAVALYHMRKETSVCLLKHIEFHKVYHDTLFFGKSGDELLVLAASSKDFDFATLLKKNYTKLNSEDVLIALAQNLPPELNFWERKLGTFLIRSCFRSTKLMSVCPFILERVRTHGAFKDFVWSMCSLIRHSTDPNSYQNFYTDPIFEATKQNAVEVVETILHFFPSAIWSRNDDGHNIIQYAVINHSEKVYHLLLQMSEYRNTYVTIKDSNGNNLLHLAAKLSPPNKLNLISGAALQIQHEVRWFKEVESFVSPLKIIYLNDLKESPQMIFKNEHEQLVIEGEKWMKTTAESYTITAALITTMVFAAAIPVPGGNNQDTGIPIFTNNIAFTIFAITDAISLFTSITSLLMFLSILTARYTEEDFLIKLPTKLIIGLATLFISTTAMIIAFGATLFIVFGQNNSLILIPIVALTCLPITSFVTLQFPLVADLISATYGRSIFGKKMITTFHNRFYLPHQMLFRD